MSEILAKYLIDMNKTLDKISDKINSGSGSSSGGTGSGTGASITVDSALSSDSANPVQNKAITTALDQKQSKLTAGAGIKIDDDGTISVTLEDANATKY